MANQFDPKDGQEAEGVDVANGTEEVTDEKVSEEKPGAGELVD